MDLHLAMLKAISFYLLHSVSTLNNAESFPVSQLCGNTLPATKITLITDLLEYEEKIKLEIQPLGNKLESRNQL
jgi:hypothetical protein